MSSQTSRPSPPLTGKKRLANWFPYNKLWIAAFAARDKWAISVEFMCTDSFTGNSYAILEQLLSGFHYNDE